jgi:hypothetical protein
VEKNQQRNDLKKDPSLENRSAMEPNNEPNKQDRAGDFGNSGQFAPGGYYNQQGAAKPDRIDLDDELAPRRQLGNRQ